MTRWLAVVVVGTLVVAACGSAQAPSANPVKLCAPPAEPGPADEPDRDSSDLMDMTDYGGGRMRLCLDGPVKATAERTAWCVWAADRTAVSEVNGLPVTIGAVEYQAFLSIARNQFEFSATDRGQGGLLAIYAPGPIVPSGDATDDGRSGNLAFDVVLTFDPESGAPPGAQPRYGGSMRWQCGDPPPPR